MSMPIPISSYQDYLAYLQANAHAKTMEAYPKFQYSVFLGEGRDEQIVVRADSFEEFAKLKEESAALLPNGLSRKSSAGNGSAKTLTCAKCGGEAEMREGVSRKTDKPYRGVFCLNQDCNYARFL